MPTVREPGVAIPCGVVVPVSPVLPISTVHVVSTSLVIPSEVQKSVYYVAGKTDASPFELVDVYVTARCHDQRIHICACPGVDPEPGT